MIWSLYRWLNAGCTGITAKLLLTIDRTLVYWMYFGALVSNIYLTLFMHHVGCYIFLPTVGYYRHFYWHHTSVVESTKPVSICHTTLISYLLYLWFALLEVYRYNVIVCFVDHSKCSDNILWWFTDVDNVQQPIQSTMLGLMYYAETRWSWSCKW